MENVLNVTWGGCTVTVAPPFSLFVFVLYIKSNAACLMYLLACYFKAFFEIFLPKGILLFEGIKGYSVFEGFQGFLHRIRIPLLLDQYIEFCCRSTAFPGIFYFFDDVFLFTSYLNGQQQSLDLTRQSQVTRSRRAQQRYIENVVILYRRGKFEAIGVGGYNFSNFKESSLFPVEFFRGSLSRYIFRIKPNIVSDLVCWCRISLFISFRLIDFLGPSYLVSQLFCYSIHFFCEFICLLDLDFSQALYIIVFFQEFDTQARILSICSEEGRYSCCFRNSVIKAEFGQGSPFVPVVLVIINISAEILFNNRINPFCLSICFRVEGRGKISSYPQSLTQLSPECRDKLRSLVRDNRSR